MVLRVNAGVNKLTWRESSRRQFHPLRDLIREDQIIINIHHSSDSQSWVAEIVDVLSIVLEDWICLACKHPLSFFRGWLRNCSKINVAHVVPLRENSKLEIACHNYEYDAAKCQTKNNAGHLIRFAVGRQILPNQDFHWFPLEEKQQLNKNKFNYSLQIKCNQGEAKDHAQQNRKKYRKHQA